MPVTEKALQLAADEGTAQPPSQPSERQGVFDVVLEVTPEWTFRDEAMAVFPAGKRPFHLRVTELPARLIAMVPGDPAAPSASGPHGEDDLPTVFDAAATFENSDSLPGRGQALEGTGSRMPSEYLVGREWHGRPKDETLGFHNE
jgi:hypothetical protein